MNVYRLLKDNGYNVTKIDHKLITDSNVVGKGKGGIVYHLNDNSCFKIFHNSLSEDDIVRLNAFCNLKINSAVFPNSLVVVKNDVRGYTMDFVDGKIMEECSEFDFSCFLSKYDEYMKKCLVQFSDNNIEMFDVGYTNIMFNQQTKSFQSIDVDNWIINQRDVYDFNFRRLSSAFFCYAFSLLSLSGENFSKHFSKLIISKQGDFIDFYECVRENVQNVLGRKLHTVGDVREGYMEYVKKI